MQNTKSFQFMHDVLPKRYLEFWNLTKVARVRRDTWPSTSGTTNWTTCRSSLSTRWHENCVKLWFKVCSVRRTVSPFIYVQDDLRDCQWRKESWCPEYIKRGGLLWMNVALALMWSKPSCVSWRNWEVSHLFQSRFRSAGSLWEIWRKSSLWRR